MPLRARRWYLVAGELRCRERPLGLCRSPVHDPSFHDQPAAQTESTSAVRLAGAARPFLFAAWHEGRGRRAERRRRLVTGGHYNGKLDRPRLADRALERGRDRWHSAADGALPVGAEHALVAALGLLARHPGGAPRRHLAQPLHGRIVNLPARAMTGHNWTGAVHGLDAGA